MKRITVTFCVYLLLSLCSSAHAVLTAPATDVDGNYQVSWSVTGTTSCNGTAFPWVYRLEERRNSENSVYYYITNPATKVYNFSGKSNASYTYTLSRRYCNYSLGRYNPGTIALPSKTVVVAPPPPPPAAPSLTLPVNSDTGSYRATWNRPTGSQTFTLQERIGSGAWVTVYNSYYSYFDIVDNSTNTYSYRVNACGVSGCGAYSTIKTVSVVGVDRPGSLSDIPDGPFQPVSAPLQDLVGELAGAPSVSGGAFTYSIPIAIPPGINAMQPEVALTYSSQSGLGIAGDGWSLNAASSVARCANNYAQDGRVRTVQRDFGDSLCLNGDRLILMSGTHGRVGATYRPESSMNLTVYLKGAGIESSSSFFEIRHKNGKLEKFGKPFVPVNTSANSALNSVPLRWNLSEVKDLFGNTINYGYSSGAGYAVLANIYYTGRNGALGNRRLEFVYDTPQSNASIKARDRYGYNFKSTSSHRLRRINIHVENEETDHYVLKHAATNALEAVEHCFDTACLKSTFTYHRSTGPSFSETEDHVASDMTDSHEFSLLMVPFREVGDYDGDGIDELSYYRTENGQGKLHYVFSSTGEEHSAQEFNYLADSQGLSIDYDCEEMTDINCVTRYSIFSSAFRGEMDFNADGRRDIVYINTRGKVAIANWHASTSIELNIDGNCEIPSWGARTGVTNCQSFVLDLNGDGLQDLLVASGSHSSNTVVYRAYIRRQNSNAFDHAGEFSSSTLNAYQLSDIDGDGQLDLVAPSLHAWIKISIANSIVSFSKRDLAFKGSINRGSTQRSTHTHMADLNGDGLSDFLILSLKPAPANNYDLGWYVSLNTGNGRFSSLVYTGRSEENSSANRVESQTGTNSLAPYMLSFDYDNDGQMDYLLPHRSRLKYTCVNYPLNVNNCYDEHETFGHYKLDVYNWKVWQTNPDGTSFTEIILGDDVLGALATTALVDYNGDGVEDIVSNVGFDNLLTWDWRPSSIIASGTHVYLRNQGQYRNSLLKSVTTDFGEKLRVDYAPLNGKGLDGRDMYSVNLTPNHFPSVNFGSSMTVVDQISSDDGLGAFQAKRYNYADARFNVQGRGFQGFRVISVENLADDTETATTFFQEYPLTGVVRESTLRRRSDNLLMKRSYAVPGSEVTVPGCAYIGEQVSERYELISGTSPYSKATSKVSYDANCNQRFSETTTVDYRDIYNNSPWITHSAKTDLVFDAVAGMQGVYRKRSEILTTDVSYAADSRGVILPNDNNRKIVTSTYAYANTSTNVPQSVTVSGGVNLTQRFTYDAFGHVTRKITSGTELTGSKERWSETRYTSDGYFIDHTLNSQWGTAVKAESFSEYDKRLGLPRLATDANGIETHSQYNALGLLIEQSVEKNGIEAAPPTYTSYRWCDGACPSGVYSITTEQSGALPLSSYFDSLGREVTTEAQSFNGQTATSHKIYNARGLLESEISAGGASITFEQFDAFGRPERKVVDQSPKLYTSNYTYEGLKVNILVSGERTLSMSKTINSRDQLMRTQDAAGEVAYFAYDGSGNPTLLRDVNGMDIRAVYNHLGQKTQVRDPNQGITTFTYNGLGELLTSRDANNTYTVFEMDHLGRTTRKTQGSDVSVWHYDSEHYGLMDRDSRAGHQRDYDYDAFGRLLRQGTSIDGELFEHHWVYDSVLGRAKGTRAPNGTVVAYEFDQDGYKLQDYQPAVGGGVNKIYAHYLDYEVTGQVKAQQFGNGVIQSFDYALASGMLNGVCAGVSSQCNDMWSAQHMAYQYDGFGNLTDTIDHIGHLDVDYFYDDLHRLDSTHTRLNDAAATVVEYSYDAVGNILNKSDYAQNYRYGNLQKTAGGNAGPNAVRQISKNGALVNLSYDNAGNLVSGDGLSISYDGNHHTKSVIRDGANLTFYYDANGMRYKQVNTRGSAVTTTYYINDYEVTKKSGTISGQENQLYVGGHTILTQTISGASASPSITHVLRDRLGSASIVLDGDRTIAQGHAAQSLVIERRAYDAFGKAIILPAGVLPSLFAVTDRGFTDHEHLLDVKLIHMNGRAFDYNLGRFLSVDPFITGAGDSQSANPYSYIGNNPMSGVDPTGYQRTHESDVDTAPPPNVDETQHTVAVRTSCEMTRGVGGSCDSAIPLSSTGSGGDTSKVNEHFSDVGKAGGEAPDSQPGFFPDGLTKGQYLEAVENGLWENAPVNSGFKNNKEVSEAGDKVNKVRQATKGDVIASEDMVNFVIDTAKATAKADIPIEGEKFMALGRNANGEVVVLRVGIVEGQGGKFGIPSNTLAIAHVHYKGLTQNSPGPGDHHAVKGGRPAFMINRDGSKVFEVGRIQSASGAYNYRRVKSDGHGDWKKLRGAK